MNREDKVLKIQALKEKFSNSPCAVVAENKGLSVSDIEVLRRDLRGANAEFRVAKNTLLKLAVADSSADKLDGYLYGTTGVIFVSGEPVNAAKAIVEFAKEHENLEVRAGILDGNLISADELTALSKLPGRQELLGKLLGVMTAVPTGFVSVLSGVPRKLVYALQAVKEQKEN